MKFVCRINKNHMAQFEHFDGFVVFNFKRKLDGRRFGMYEISIRKLPNDKAKPKRVNKNHGRTASTAA